ncbi:unnamed protein product [Lactuca saligna]|uniref:Uncharacterized protein n=1 Tax=Lactuca saligna TaxID=75948 RepID=A0AA35YN05_LACSI|nr:unnamed protein product [Lactuca saligna]
MNDGNDDMDQMTPTPEAMNIIVFILPSASLRAQSVTVFQIAMTTMKQSVTEDLRKDNDQKTPTMFKVFEEFETDGQSYESSSEDMETYSPKSVVKKLRKWPATVKDINVDAFSRRVRNQIERIRAEDSHLGEDIGECLIAKVSVSVHDLVDVVIFSRPASPLSGKIPARINMVQ